VRAVTPTREMAAASARKVVAWPEIDGIDAADVRRRMGDRLGLFLSLLKRLLKEYPDIRVPSGAHRARACDSGRMHKLRGAAAMLGARTIQQLAAAAEAACLVGDADRAADLAAEVSAHLQRLRRSAAPALAQLRTVLEAATPSASSAPAPQDFPDLVNLLRQQNLAATDRFSALTSQLQRLLAKRSFDLLYMHMQDLEFSDAADILEASLQARDALSKPALPGSPSEPTKSIRRRSRHPPA
jgi:HPt (histidine-containing phosphotransfer) domain-containing protein